MPESSTYGLSVRWGSLRCSLHACCHKREQDTGQGSNKKTPTGRSDRGFSFGSLAVSYFRTVYLALSSALRRFTVLFGMGRRGTTSLWPPGKALYSLHLTNWKKSSGPSIASLSEQAPMAHVVNTQGYRIKPHGQLVSVSSTHCCACTPDLSTLSSATTLKWG